MVYSTERVLMYCELVAIINPRVLVLCANQRLAFHLQHLYNQHQQHNGLKVWPSAQIFPLNSWLVQQWQKNTDDYRILINEYEETLLWQNIISDNPGSDLLLNINNTAELAQQAWQTLTLWQIELNTLDNYHNQDVAQFLQWATRFNHQKQQKQFLLAAELTQTVIQQLSTTKNHLLEKVITVGFDDLAPATAHLFQKIQQHAEYFAFESKPKTQTLVQTSLQDEEQEIYSMACWAKQNLKPNHQNKIGCVIPNLSKIRDKVTSIFTDVFCPNNIIPGHSQQEMPYNISAGTQFHLLPMIKTALAALHLQSGEPLADKIQQVLLSPYINGLTSDRCLAALVARELYPYPNKTFHHETIIAIIAEFTQHEYPQASLLERWQAMCAIPRKNGKESLQQWALYFEQVLEAIGWPGQRSLSSDEYQILQRWQSLQLELIKLDRLFLPVNQSQALNMLLVLCQQTIFQVQSNDAPIQILGLLEASGCQFDQLWLMGLDNEAWPPKAEPNPFIPIELQRRLGMPHASAQRELRYCQQIQQRVFNSAYHVVVSYAKQQGDKVLLPSPLIHGIPKIAHSNFNLPTTELTLKKLEMMIDDQGPPVGEHEKITGGSWILQQQALCPFRAFASIRLNAKPIVEPEIGLTASQRGILCHQALDFIWKKIKTQRNLLNYSTQEIQTIIAECIDAAATSGQLKNDHFLSIERQRLQLVLTYWLDLEMTRPPFKVIERETERHIQIGQLDLRIQIDRIDALDDGKYIIIDYKTSKNNSVQNWFGERLLEPQLPIYCLYGSENSIGIAYAEVNRGNPQFKGIINHEHNFSKIIPAELANPERLSWDELCQKWQKSLNQHSAAFCAGVATVDPENPTVCQHCHLHTLCREGIAYEH